MIIMIIIIIGFTTFQQIHRVCVPWVPYFSKLQTWSKVETERESSHISPTAQTSRSGEGRIMTYA
jgi:uncharacterized membrane protein